MKLSSLSGLFCSSVGGTFDTHASRESQTHCVCVCVREFQNRDAGETVWDDCGDEGLYGYGLGDGIDFREAFEISGQLIGIGIGRVVLAKIFH